MRQIVREVGALAVVLLDAKVGGVVLGDVDGAKVGLDRYVAHVIRQRIASRGRDLFHVVGADGHLVCARNAIDVGRDASHEVRASGIGIETVDRAFQGVAIVPGGYVGVRGCLADLQ